MMNFDDILDQHLGPVGRYQWFIFIFLTVSGITAGMIAITVVFAGGAGQGYACIPHDLGNQSYSVYTGGNTTLEKCQYMPTVALNASHSQGGNWTYSRSVGPPEAEKCRSWVYDREGQFNTSFVTQYGLTCDKEWLIPLTQTVYMCGWLLGTFIFGSLSDRFGRMSVVPAGYFLQSVIAVAVPFIPNYYAALLFRFLLGITSGGTDLIRFVLCMEFFNEKWRTIVGCVLSCGFSIGLIIAAGIAYAMEPVNHITLQIIYGSTPLFFVIIRWIIPESPRWLAGNHQFDKAEAVVRRIARLNGRPLKKDVDFHWDQYKEFCEKTESETVRRYSILDLFKTPNIRRVTFASGLVWFSSAGIYYGFLFLNKDLGANVYINTIISGATGVVSPFVCMPFFFYLGRRSTMMVFEAVMTVLLVAVIFIMDKPEYDTVILVIVTIGKFCNILVFDGAYLQSAEIFPTCVRSLGVGVGSLCARIAALCAPLISNLVIYWPKLPLVVFAIFALVGTLMELLLPETVARPLPETIEDGEQFARSSLEGFCHVCSNRWAKRDKAKETENGAI